MSRQIILLYGPTASGKSSLAWRLAERLDGVVINADAMQSYRDLRLLTARPDADESSKVPHYLYGVRDICDVASAAGWAEECARLLDELGNRSAIICGGSGLYLEALVGGLSSIPDISDEVRRHYEERLKTEGLQVLYEELCLHDRDWGERIQPSDAQRILRGLSVYRGTGVALSEWHRSEERQAGFLGYSYVSVLLLPERDLLWRRSRERILSMVGGGCLFELMNLLGRGVSDDLPLMRAIGVREFGLYLGGDIGLDESIDRVWYSTRRYIKRQFSWSRNRYDYDVLLDDCDDVEKVLDACKI